MPDLQQAADTAFGPALTGDANLARTNVQQGMAQRQQLLQQLEQARTQESGVRQDIAKEQQPINERMATMQPRQSNMPVPEAPKAPEPQKIDPNTLKESAGAMMVMAGLLGAFSRTGALGAVTSMTSFMQGLNEGNQEKAKQAAQEYSEKVEEFHTKLDALKEDRAELAKMDQRDLGEMQRQLQLIAAKHDLELVSAKSRVDSYTATLKELDSSIANWEKMLESSDRSKANMLSVVLREEHKSGNAAGLSLSPDQEDALFGEHGAVTEGRLSMDKVNSRTARLLADAELKSKGHNWAGDAADIALNRNPTFRQRAMTAETLPTIMENMVESGKKLNYSDLKIVGEMEKWTRGQTNDPDLAEYMVQRNDALLTIAGVMRGVGMTDQAHRAETEIASPTFSPRALDAWMRGQMKALQPRLEQNRKITDKGNHPAAPNKVSSDADYDALPSGATFVGPDGKTRRKP